MKKTNFTFLKKQTQKLMLLCSLFLLTSVQYSYSQCSLACNGTTNISLDDASCEALITVSMIADTSGCVGGDFEVTVNDALGNAIPGALITSAYVGQTLEVIVTDLNTNNSCWGNIVIEDKLPPTITCPDPTGPVYCYTVDDYQPVADDNCGVAEVILIDSTETINDCSSGFSDEVIKVITKTYIAVDEQGLESAPCTVEMEVLRIPSLSDIDGPASLLWVDDTALECDADFPLNADGFPSPIEVDGVAGTGVPVLDGVDLYPNPYSICNLLVTYTDVELFPGGCVTKIMRTWKVIEWSCSNPQRTYDYIQMIEIVDNDGPDMICPDDITASTNTHYCEATVLLPPAQITDNCSDDITVNITYQGGPLMNTNGGLANLDVGTNIVTYTAYDGCGNSSQCDVEVYVADLTPPVTVCDQFTTVALTSDGYAWVHASVFDDGSYDECELASLTVKRMDDGVPCDNVDDDIFDEYVRFCCVDQGEDVMVILRATDAAGNVNDCMVSVTVQDKLAPTILCPADLTVNCDFAYDEENLNQFFGEPTVIDNCTNPVVTDVLTGTLNQCNIGTLTRTISVGEEGTSNFASCVQFITFTPLDPFNEFGDDIDWPDDVLMEGCSDPTSPDFLPENLPVDSQFPTFTEGACDLVGANYDDQVFPFNNNEGDACFKIIRTWTVIDWCQFESGSTGTTYPEWTYIQIIKINDPIGPEITSSCERVSACTYDSDCLDGSIELTASATDNCTELLKWTYMIDANNDGSFEPGLTQTGVGNSIDASGVYPIGSHRVLYTFEDKCGNVVSCEQLFDIVNCKAPTPYCLNGLAVDLMPIDEDGDGTIDGGMVELWATDFDAGSSHPCGYQVYISFDPVFFSETGNTTLPNGLKIEVNNGREFTCENLGDQSVDIYAAIVTPQDSIIQAFCTTFVNVQDNNGACTDMKAEIQGGITTVSNNNLVDAEVELIGSELAIVMTDDEGHYAFPSMPYGGQYAVSPVKNDDYMNGVSTLDLVMIQRHILGIEELDSPYKVVAADINKDEKIASSDLLQLRKLILGTISEFPDNGSWRFIDAAFEFADPTDVFATPLPEDYNIATLNSDMTIDFIAVKVGDVTDNAITNLAEEKTAPRSNNTMELVVDNQSFESGELVSVPLKLNNEITSTGMQFTIELSNNLEFIGLTSRSIDVDDYNVGFSRLSDGILTVSWNNPSGVSLSADDVLFELNFTSVASGDIADGMNINSKAINAEVYNDDLQTYAIDFVVDGREISDVEFALHQNSPNPFGESTLITFDLPESISGNLTVFDVTGKVITRIQRKFEKGYNQITLDRTQLRASGVMYYQLEAGEYFASKKMIMID
ncbi:MAG: HYR domain-containing protein [Saprospiraceae bacterium]|nr:HYR domain-containing protein [Saprospiraceae bacterium]